MADGIHGIGYGNTSGVGGGYIPRRKGNDVDANNAQDQTAYNANQEHKDVNPDEVMKFMANQNFFIDVQLAQLDKADGKVDGKFNVDSIDDEAQDRIAGYMERFEEIYAIVENEFGAELAPSVMDLVMDKLMGMA